MRFERTCDVLKHVQTIHHKQSEFYENLGDDTDIVRLEMLLRYVSRRKKNLEETLAGCTEETSEMILETWFQYTLTKKAEKNLQALLLNPRVGFGISNKLMKISRLIRPCWNRVQSCE